MGTICSHNKSNVIENNAHLIQQQLYNNSMNNSYISYGRISVPLTECGSNFMFRIWRNRNIF